MDIYINKFLKTELTLIPSLLRKFIGTNYNNTLCNGAFWVFVFWYLWHIFFDNFLNALLKKMKYKEYLRIRLKQSLWYLGFYVTAFLYCGAVLAQNNKNLFIVVFADDLYEQSKLGFLVLQTFYFHSAIWEFLNYFNVFQAASHLCLFLLSLISIFFRFTETFLKLLVFMCLNLIFQEFVRCAISVRAKEFSARIYSIFWIFSGSLFNLLTLTIVPYFMGRILYLKNNSLSHLIISLLCIWLTIEFCNSIFFKAIVHYTTHSNEERCLGDILECSLFPQRTDPMYEYSILKKEMKKRQDETIALRKPKGRGMMFQTLKCMVALKKKLNEKRKSNLNSKELQDDTDNASDTVISENLDSSLGNSELLPKGIESKPKID